MPTNQRRLEKYPLVLPVGNVIGQQQISLSSSYSYISISNPTIATISLGVGQLGVAPSDAQVVQPLTSSSFEMQNTEYITVFWTSQSPIPVSGSNVLITVSNEPITLQVAAFPQIDSTGATTVNANVNSVPAVVVSSLPKVVVSSLPSVVVSSMPTPNLVQGVVNTSQVAVGTTSTQVLTTPMAGTKVMIKNLDATNAVYLGAFTVTTGTGYPLGAGQSITFDVAINSQFSIFAIATASVNLATMTLN